jgi:hypothetical protein
VAFSVETMPLGQFQNILFDPPTITASRRDQRAFLLLFTGRCSAKSPHNRAGSVPQKSALVTSGISNAEGSASFPPAVPRWSFCCGSVPAVSPPPLHFPVRRTAGRSLRWIAEKLMLMQPSPMAETSRLPSLRFCINESFLAVKC